MPGLERIKLLKRYKGNAPGTIIEVSKSEAKRLIVQDVATLNFLETQDRAVRGAVTK
jgi:hypothetical protein